MQGTGGKDSVSQNAILLGGKKIIEFPIEFSQKKYRRPINRTNSKNKIITIKVERGTISVSKKLSVVSFNTKQQGCAFLEEENLIFLITCRKKNFPNKFIQSGFYRWSMKIMHSFRSPWASNSPRF